MCVRLCVCVCVCVCVYVRVFVPELGCQPSKNLKGWYGLFKANHTPSNFSKAIFYKFYLFHSWIHWPIFHFLCAIRIQTFVDHYFKQWWKAKEKKAWKKYLSPQFIQVTGNLTKLFKFLSFLRKNGGLWSKI